MLPSPSDSPDRSDSTRSDDASGSTAEPWWWAEARESLRPGARPIRVALHDLVLDALAHSYYVKAIGDSPLIARTAITSAAAEFDTRSFLESRFVRQSDPTGSFLETGGPPRLRSEDWRHEFGVARRLPRGGEATISQRIGTYDSNSQFLTPPNQGNARMAISFTQPLLNGAGCTYNEALIVLARLESHASRDRTLAQLQAHLLELTDVYWTLLLERAKLVQRRRHLVQAEQIARRLRDRLDVDAARIQILQADAAVAARRSELLQSELAISSAQQRIRALVNSPRLPGDLDFELIPTETPARHYVPHDLRDAMALALRNRPEVDESMQRVYMASKRLEMADNELLPVLDLVLETYVAGLRGDVDIGRAWTDQFSMGEPGYTVGLRFEVPLGNRAARARHDRRTLELRQASNSLQATMESLKAEVAVAIHGVDTTFRQRNAKRAAVGAARAEVDYLFSRWRLLPENGRSPSDLLDDLLRAQDRLAFEEQGAAQAEYAYTMALANAKREMGLLLQGEGLPRGRPEGPTRPDDRQEGFQPGDSGIPREGNPVPMEFGSRSDGYRSGLR